MATVLVTGAGGAAGIGATKSLAETTSHDIVGVDMDPDAPGLFLADEAETVPPASADDWVSAMSSVVREHDVDVVVPTVDEELSRLPELRTAVPEAGIVAPEADVVDVALDKRRTSDVLDAAGHTVPRTWSGTDAGRIPHSAYPVLAKPRRGRGSRGVERLDAPEDLELYFERSDRDRGEVVVQEWIDGTEYTTSVVSTRDNRLLSVVPKEAIEKAGSTVRGVTRRAPEVVASCRSIHETLQPAGPLNLQQIVDDDGRVYTIEINPRFSSTACLTVAAGVDELDLLIRDALGKRVEEPPAYEPDVHILRYQDSLFFSEDDPGAPADEPVESVAGNP